MVRPDDFSKDRLESLRGQLRLDSDLSDEEARQIEDLVLEFADVFALEATELGSTGLVTHTIDTGDSPPIKQQARCVPFALRHVVEDMVADMLEQGVVEPSRSPWSSPVVLVEKKDGSKRTIVT